MSASGGELRFAPDHPALAGHFPQHPVVPGVLLLDAALHSIESAAAADRLGASNRLGAAGPPWHILAVKFHRLVQADESLQLHVAPQADRTLRFELRSGEALAVSGSIARGAA
jgi:3-hydroxymyristoyl/3-hydroxydecanoyl-(acyl carrier protein) dehydratase